MDTEGQANTTWINSLSFQKYLGCGAYGIVIEATSKVNPFHSAIKVNFPDYSDGDEAARMRQQVQREYKTMVGKHHQNVVQIINFTEKSFSKEDIDSLFQHMELDDRVHDRIAVLSNRARRQGSIEGIYIQMEVCGRTLRDWLTDNPVLKPELHTAQVGIVQGLVEGLKFIHANNIIHRDLKPENVMFSYSDNKAADTYVLPVKIGDFGLCRRIHSDDSMSSNSLTAGAGTLDYRAPEANYNEYGMQADLHSLGLVMWEVLQLIVNRQRKSLFDKLVNDGSTDLVHNHPIIKNSKELIVSLTKRKIEERLKSVGDIRLDITT